jgi:membrane-bound lytic murein transglycosylase B
MENIMRLTRARFVAAVFFIAAFPAISAADTIANQQAALQAQLDEINKEIAQNQSQLSAQQKQRTSLERDVAILDSQIAEAQLEIKQRDLTIRQIKNNIVQKQAGIASLDTHVAAGEASLAQILREEDQIDNTSLAARVLGGTVNDFFNEIDDFAAIQKALGDAFTAMALQRADLAARKRALQDQQQEQSDLLQLQVAQQNSLKATERQKQDLVTAAKGQEAIYQQIIAGKQQTAAQIKAALFALNGANHSTSFGDMYAYAKEAGAVTHVRPAFILGILREESDLGQNVGTGNWRVDMNQTRDAPVFQQICAALGLNPDSQPVSKRQSYGYGGAMGPAQFIPSTWQLYADRIAGAAGQNPPNPWDPRTATFASALLLADNGADAQTAGAERLAALRYLAGWKNASKSAYAFYGEAVMSFADQYQQDINVLGG